MSLVNKHLHRGLVIIHYVKASVTLTVLPNTVHKSVSSKTALLDSK